MKYLFVILSFVFLFGGCKKENKTSGTSKMKYTISYNGNGSTGGQVPVDTTKYEKDAKVVVKDNEGNLVKTGFSFLQWNTRANGSGTNIPPSSTISIGADITLYAQWGVSSFYPVTYSGNGNTSGGIPVNYTLYAMGDTATVFGNTGNLMKDGNSFLNWNTAADASGTTYLPGAKIVMTTSVNLYAIYDVSVPSSKFYGFDNDGYLKSKSTLTSPWAVVDSWNDFGDILVTAVWDGSKYLGLGANGLIKSKSSDNSPWQAEDQVHSSGSSLVSAVWNGIRLIGFDAYGFCESKYALNSPWTQEDQFNSFGTPLTCVVWNGSVYVGFDYNGLCKSKASLYAPWITQDMSNTFGDYIAEVVWDGSKYIGFNMYGQCKTKSSLTSPWVDGDLTNMYNGYMMGLVYH